MIIADRGLNARWERPVPWVETGQDLCEITLREPLGRSWRRELVSYPFPGNVAAVSHLGQPVPFQLSAGKLWLRIADLAAGEVRRYQVRTSKQRRAAVRGRIQICREEDCVIADNGLIALKLPASRQFEPADGEALPGPIVALRHRGGDWFGRGGLRTSHRLRSIRTSVAGAGELWTEIRVAYDFGGQGKYSLRARIFPDESFCEISEQSSLPVNLRPGPRPYREIGTLGASHWSTDHEAMGKPCLRPFPFDLFTFDLAGAGLKPDRMQTHSTSSWELLDIPIAADGLRAYTALRGVNPSMDGGWMGFHAANSGIMFGIASKDIAGWRIPDDTLHPVHKTPAAAAEVVFLAGRNDVARLAFPLGGIGRNWILAVCEKTDHPEFFPELPAGEHVKLPASPSHPLWALRNRLGDLRLDKVKDWVLDWPDSGLEHPSVLCRKEDFPEIREKVREVPEFAENYRRNRELHSSDRFIIEGTGGGLAAIEKTTGAKALVEKVLSSGYTGPLYAIGLSRPLRRYALACDIEWDSFTAAEKREARRVCALAAYILSDGDFWQYAWQPGGTGYLPNFNTDVFTCYGLLGLFLADHPCSRIWVEGMVKRLELDLEHTIHDDGGGEENLGGYNISSWTQLWLPAFWSLKHGGIRDFSADPRLQAAARFFLDILGPPDPRDRKMARLIPPVGHHPHRKKRAQVCAWLAAFLKDSNPGLAANLMWFWNETGRPIAANEDHAGAAADPHTLHYIFSQPWIQPAAYAQQSKLLPRVGAVLHSHTGSGQGSFLLLKSGRVHSHHDADEGSFHYVGRGVPLANDGLPLMNIRGANSAELHNVVSFARPGQPAGRIDKFFTSAACDYIRAVIAPRAYASDAMFADGSHESGFTREIMLVKAAAPGGVEYVVLKDRVCGPDHCQWNLDVLSRKPEVRENGRVWFPGHDREGFGMGLEVWMLAPAAADIRVQEGLLGEEYMGANLAAPKAPDAEWLEVGHWNLHVPAPPGTTFLAVLFPRRHEEKIPEIAYSQREEVLTVGHAEGSDQIFLRSNPLPVNLDGFVFQGAAGLVARRHGGTTLIRAEAALLKQVSRNSRVVELK